MQIASLTDTEAGLLHEEGMDISIRGVSRTHGNMLTADENGVQVWGFREYLEPEADLGGRTKKIISLWDMV